MGAIRNRIGRLKSHGLGLAVVTAGALLLGPQAASAASNCLQDEFTLAGNSQTLNCTANDVRVAKVINVRDLSGNTLTSCEGGTTFNFIADFLVETTSSSSRSNIGLYFATGNVNTQTTALTGSCSDNIISPMHTCAGSTVTCGSTSYEELDPLTTSSGAPVADNCGDTSSSDPAVCLDATNQVVACSSPSATQTFPATQVVTVEIDNFQCVAPSGSTSLVLPNCTSWQVPGKTIECQSPPSSYPYPFDTNGHAEAIPGSPSKCNCATIPLPVIVQSPSVSVTKNCQTANGSGTLPTPSCTLTPEGGQVTYTVAMTNNSNFGGTTIDQICDSVYGTVYRASAYTGAACAVAGSIPATSTSCGGTGTTKGAIDIPAGQSQSCTFTVTQAESLTVTDIISVSGHGDSGGTAFGPTESNSCTVTSGEAPSTATITKGMVSTTSGCATVRYSVDVANTSGFDENLSLTSLNDTAYGSITSVHDNVLGTTCGVANGLGTLAGTGNGAGTLPASLPVGGSDYTCRFDARFCGGLGTITLPSGSTCNGISHTNKVTGTFTGDESADQVTLTNNTFTVYECFSSFVSSTTP